MVRYPLIKKRKPRKKGYDWLVRLIDADTGAIIHSCVEPDCDAAKETGAVIREAPIFSEFENKVFEVCKRIHDKEVSGKYVIENPVFIG